MFHRLELNYLSKFILVNNIFSFNLYILGK